MKFFISLTMLVYSQSYAKPVVRGLTFTEGNIAVAANAYDTGDPGNSITIISKTGATIRQTFYNDFAQILDLKTDQTGSLFASGGQWQGNGFIAEINKSNGDIKEVFLINPGVNIFTVEQMGILTNGSLTFSGTSGFVSTSSRGHYGNLNSGANGTVLLGDRSQLYDLTVDAHDNAYFGGSYIPNKPGSEADEFISLVGKLDPQGNQLWLKQFPRANMLWNHDMTTSLNREGVVMGLSHYRKEQNYFETLLISLDGNGNTLWTTTTKGFYAEFLATYDNEYILIRGNCHEGTTEIAHYNRMGQETKVIRMGGQEVRGLLVDESGYFVAGRSDLTKFDFYGKRQWNVVLK